MALFACCALAKEIINAGERVVLNHSRCRYLVTRVNSLLPYLQQLVDMDQQAASRWVEGEQGPASRGDGAGANCCHKPACVPGQGAMLLPGV